MDTHSLAHVHRGAGLAFQVCDTRQSWLVTCKNIEGHGFCCFFFCLLALLSLSGGAAMQTTLCYSVLGHSIHAGVPLELELVVKQAKADQSTCLIGFLDLALKMWDFQILPLVGISTEEKYVTRQGFFE